MFVRSHKMKKEGLVYKLFFFHSVIDRQRHLTAEKKTDLYVSIISASSSEV